MMGMLNASQNRTNLAPFTDELMSKQPKAKKEQECENSQFLNHGLAHIL
jgi:hypothetical protein